METLTKLKNETKQKVIVEKVLVANTMVERMVGLLGRESFDDNSAMWIKRNNSIHTWFMKFPIDAIFVDKKLKVTALHKNIEPWRLILPVWRANSVFELSSGKIDNSIIEIGDQLNVGD